MAVKVWLTFKNSSMTWLMVTLATVVARCVASQELGGSRSTRRSRVTEAWGALAGRRSPWFRGLWKHSRSSSVEIELKLILFSNMSSKVKCASNTSSSDISCNLIIYFSSGPNDKLNYIVASI